ncbi:MAG: transposase [Desulfovibrionaceae bacterium]|nr:transposase [Desulfovibrionaceae bacterium]
MTTTTENNGTVTTENQFIPSNADCFHFVTGTRQHWRIENTLHWKRDVVYGEDKSCIQKENAPSNILGVTMILPILKPKTN